jgi:hypothetical protein
MRRWLNYRTFLLIPIALCMISSGFIFSNSASASKSPASLKPAMRSTNASAAAWTYTLPKLTSCEVGDGLTVVFDGASTTLHITGVRLVVAPARYAPDLRTSYQLVALRKGSTTGEIADSFHLSELSKGSVMGNPVGRSLPSTGGSEYWFGVVARIRLAANVPTQWRIHGLRISYSVGAKSYATLMPGMVKLPSTTRC